jgi:hypothetical protein
VVVASYPGWLVCDLLTATSVAAARQHQRHVGMAGYSLDPRDRPPSLWWLAAVVFLSLAGLYYIAAALTN